MDQDIANLRAKREDINMQIICLQEKARALSVEIAILEKAKEARRPASGGDLKFSMRRRGA